MSIKNLLASLAVELEDGADRLRGMLDAGQWVTRDCGSATLALLVSARSRALTAEQHIARLEGELRASHAVIEGQRQAIEQLRAIDRLDDLAKLRKELEAATHAKAVLETARDGLSMQCRKAMDDAAIAAVRANSLADRLKQFRALYDKAQREKAEMVERMSQSDKLADDRLAELTDLRKELETLGPEQGVKRLTISRAVCGVRIKLADIIERLDIIEKEVGK